MSNCIFCAIVQNTAPAWVIYEDGHTMAFLDIAPATDGHTLVIPKRHVRDLWELSEADGRHVMVAAKRVAEWIKRALSPDGVNLFHATGAAAFQSVFHFHLHVVPRYNGDRVRKPWEPQPGDRDKMAAIAERIRRAAKAGG